MALEPRRSGLRGCGAKTSHLTACSACQGFPVEDERVYQGMEEIMILEGKVWVFGNNINTDLILPGKYLRVTDREELGRHAMEGQDPDFSQKMSKGDILMAGRNFGCGSSREQAPVALKYAGIAAIIAESYARIFYRNALNIGLPVLEVESTGRIAKEGDRIRIDVETGEICNLDTGHMFQAKPIPDFMLEIIREGGLINKIKKQVAKKMNQ